MNRPSTPFNGLSLLLLLAGASGCSSILEGSPFDARLEFVSAGTAHTCSVIQGSVACWGLDEFDGVVFGVVSEPPAGSSFVGIASGSTTAVRWRRAGRLSVGERQRWQVSASPP